MKPVAIAMTVLLLGMIACNLPLDLLDQQTPTPPPTPQGPPEAAPFETDLYSLVSGTCARDECLFRRDYMGESDYPVGLATIHGYYTRIERSGMDQARKTCDSFVITGGSPELIRSVLALIDSGNSVYLKDELGQPVISLNLAELDEAEQRALQASTPVHPIDLLVLAHPSTHRGAPVCFTRFEMLKVVAP